MPRSSDKCSLWTLNKWILIFRIQAPGLKKSPLVCRSDKTRENAAAVKVFQDLLQELDAKSPEARLLALIQGSLAANIFDWGARACVELYHQGTILEIYRWSFMIMSMNSNSLSNSTWLDKAMWYMPGIISHCFHFFFGGRLYWIEHTIVNLVG